VTFITGCAIVKKETVARPDGGGKKAIGYEEIKSLNITNNNFNIIKAEINIFTEGENEKLLGYIKYNNTETYLISIRNRSGIEGARILITSDSILVNDRINKKLYYGSTSYLNKKYGITTEILPIILGDFIIVNGDNRIVKCNKNTAYIDNELKGKKTHFTVDCEKMKVTSVIIEDEITERKFAIDFKKFEKYKNCYLARKITIKSSKEDERIEVNIEKFEQGVENDITFIPGKKYEKVLLK